MRRLFIIIIVILFSSNINAQSNFLKAEINECVELLSIVSRIAGYEEYQWMDIELYRKNIDDYFKPFQNDSLIWYAKKIRKETKVAHDAMMSMAVHLQITNNEIKWKDNISSNSLYDARWKGKSETFVRLLSKFYKTTNFHAFFMRYEPIYRSFLPKFDEMLKEVDCAWFSSFFGTTSQPDFHYVIALAFNGGGYGPRVEYNDGKLSVYSIIGCSVDSKGMPTIGRWETEATVHEFCHTFCNPLIDNNFQAIEKNITPYFKQVKNKELYTAYSNLKIYSYELLVRASTILYLMEHNVSDEEISNKILQEQAQGFLLMPDMVESLKEYKKVYGKSSNLNSFIPIINDLCRKNDPKTLSTKIAEESVKILSFSIENKDKNVDPNLAALKIVFNQPMKNWVNGWRIRSGGLFGKPSALPEIKSYSWNTENNELTMTIEMKADTKYKFYFAKNQTISKRGLALDKEYTLEFKTRKE